MKKRTVVLWKKILAWTIGAAAVAGAFYLYFLTDTFAIYRYELLGVSEAVAPQLEEDIRKLSAVPFLNVVPTDRLLTFRGKDMQRLVVERLPNTKRVTVRAVPLHTIRITVTPYEPLFRMEEGRAITKEGYVYTEVHDISHLPLFVGASSTILGEAGSLERQKLELIGATSTEVLFGAIADIIPKIDAVLFKVGFVTVNEYGDVLLADKEGRASVKLTSQVNMDKQWSNVISAIDTEPLKGLLERRASELEYIDVRFGNKVFYKFTNGAPPASIGEHATSTSR